MKGQLSRKMMFFVLMVAYLALLAHAFVPHHHHGEHTAFFNHKACPHEHQEHHADLEHHAHLHEDASSDPNNCQGGDCKTLKHVWIKDNQQKSIVQPAPESLDLNCFLTSYFSFLLEGVNPDERWPNNPIPINFYNLSVEASSLRGPPALV